MFRDLSSILAKFQVNNDLEYTDDFREVQSTMRYCDEFVKKFKKLDFYGGSEVYINEISTRLLKNLRSKGYIVKLNNIVPGSEDQLRKICFFLILNTEATCPLDLKRDNKISNLLNNFPQLTSTLLIHLLWNLNFNQFFGDFLSYSPCWHAIQFLPDAIFNLRHATPHEKLERVDTMVKAIYLNICRVDFRNSVENKISLGKLFDHMMGLLRHFNTPDSEPFEKWSKKSTNEYLGVALHTILKIVLHCFNIFNHKPALEVDAKYNMFKVMLEQEPEIDNHSNINYSNPVSEILLQINIALLNTLQNFLMNVTVDLFVYWVEIDVANEEDPGEELTLQKLVANSCFDLIELINVNECFKHDVVKQLECFASKPESLQDKMKAANIGEIMRKLEVDTKHGREWLGELISRGDFVFGNVECLDTILENCNLMPLNLVKTFIVNSRECELDDDSEEAEKIVEITKTCMNKLNKEEILEITQYLIDSLSEDYQLKDEEELIYDIINFKNQLTEAELSRNEYLVLMAQAPKLFFERLLDEAEIIDESQILLYTNILSNTKTISAIYLKSILLEIIGKSTSSKSKMHLLLTKLYKLKIIEQKEYLKDVVIGQIENQLTSKNYEVLLILLTTLKPIAIKMQMNELAPPILVLLGHVMDQCRWDLVKYTSLLENIVEIVAVTLLEIIKIVLLQGNAEVKNWIQSRMESTHPMTKYYFQKLSLTKDDAPKTFDSFLQTEDLTVAPKKKITAFLCENFIRCTSKEARWLGMNDFLLPFFTDAVSVISLIVGRSNNEHATNCLRKCLADYIRILDDKILPLNIKNSEELKLFKDVISLIGKIPSSLENSIVLFVDVLKSIAKASITKNSATKDEILELSQSLAETTLKNVLIEFLHEMNE